jgi:predicted kinase
VHSSGRVFTGGRRRPSRPFWRGHPALRCGRYIARVLPVRLSDAHRNRMANVHLISGLPASGKTTYAAGLKATSDGVLLTLDQWLITTHGRYRIAEIGEEEHVRRVVACRSLIWSVAREFLHRGTDVILDDGFFLRNDRMRYTRMAQEVGATSTIHFVDASLALLRTRVDERNANLPQFNFWIDPELLESFVRQFEVPRPDEASRVLLITEHERSRAVPAT